MDSELELDDDGYRTRKWRQEQLVKAGFSDFTALRIGMRLDIPKERAIHLLDLGMTESQITDELFDE